jgi:LDH2 family malate/lactate/ureidoglycolate dehydrogenase
MATSAVNRNQIAKRRSSRIALNAPVGLTAEGNDKASFTLTANATNLNRHGAAVQVSRELLVGTTVLVQNKRGARLSARIVAKVNPIQGKFTYGIEFVEDNHHSRNFWGITFPANA